MNWIREVRVALRGLGRARAFTATVVVTLAVGIGLNAAIFAVVDSVLLRPLGFREAGRIVGINTRFVAEGRAIPRLGGEDYTDLAREVHGLEAVAWYNAGPDALAVRGNALYEHVARVAPAFFRVLGVEPVAGRLLNAADLDGHDAVVSARWAREHFGSAAAAVGVPVTWYGGVYRIAGVLPEGFGFPAGTDIWFEGPAALHESRTAYSDNVVGLRRAGMSQAQLGADLQGFSARLGRNYVEDKGKAIEAESLREQLVGPVRPVLGLLEGGAGLLLLVVCANLASLLLVRGTRGVRAATLKAALGASRAALVRGTLLETVLLACLGAAGALCIATPALAALRELAPPDLPRLAEVRLNPEVLLFSLAVSLLVMVVAALLPVWRSWHVDAAGVLRSDSARAGEGRGAARLREALLVAEVALTLCLAVTAVVLAEHWREQDRQQLGFAAGGLVVLDTHAVLATAPPEKARDDSPGEKARVEAGWKAIDDANLARMRSAVQAVREQPGVEAADALTQAPMTGAGTDISYAVKGKQVFTPVAMDLPDAEVRGVTEGALRTLGVPLLRGRALSDTGDRAETERVALVNQALVRQSFGGEDPVGRTIVCGWDTAGDAPSSTWRIVGVVGDVRADGPAEPARPTFYVPLGQHFGVVPDVQVVARVTGDPASAANTLARALAARHPDLAIRAHTMGEAVGMREAPQEFRSVLFGSFAAVSLLLAAVGIYGVTAYMAEQRRREWALRMALGAGRGAVLRRVLALALRSAAIGAALGTGLSLAAGKLLGAAVGPVGALDGTGYALGVGAVALVVCGAALLPAQRAAGVEPMEALRTE